MPHNKDTPIDSEQPFSRATDPSPAVWDDVLGTTPIDPSDEQVEREPKRRFQSGDVLECVRPTNFHEVGEFVEFEGYDPGGSMPDWVRLVGKPGHYSAASFALATPLRLLTALRSPVPRELREAAQQMIDDHQTSANHHPNHVLVPIEAFEQMRHLIQKERSQ